MTQRKGFAHSDYTVAWICALPREMTAASSVLDTTHDKLLQSTTDNNTYLLGDISGHKIVVCCLPAGVYGTTAAASAVSQIRSTFPSIRFGLLVGIAGGVPTSADDVRLGDVVVSKPTRTLSGVIQYDFGKATAGGSFERLGALNRPPDTTLTAVACLQALYSAGHGRISQIISDILDKNPHLTPVYSRPGPEEDRLFETTYDHPATNDRTCSSCDGDRLVDRPLRASDEPQVHYGLIASGNVVIKDGLTRDRLARSLGNICFEMEAAGVMNIIPTLVIRGICDYSDSHKNDTWQGYAALAAAAYAREILSIIPISDKTTNICETNIPARGCSNERSQIRRRHPPSQKQGIGEVKIPAYYELLGGRLLMDITEVKNTDITGETPKSKLKKCEMTFLPPSWLSNTMLRIDANNYLGSFDTKPALEWSIRPLSINRNPQLLKALAWCDIRQLKDLFLANKARPTDMIFDEITKKPITLLEATLQAFTYSIIPCSSKLLKHKLIFQLLLDQEQRPSAQAIVSFFLSVSDKWAYDQHQVGHHLVNTYLHSVLAVGNCSLEPVRIPARLFIPEGWTCPKYGPWDGELRHSILCALIENASGFQQVHTCLFHQSQVWTTDDLTMRDTWYIGILTHTNKTFRAALEEYFSSFRSPFNATSISAAKQNAMSLFAIGRIVEQVKTAPVQERSIFLQTIIQRGPPEMFGLFLNIGIDLDEGGILENYLGTAAKVGKLPIIASLLDAGASAARALPLLCGSRGLTIDEFNSIFSRLVDCLTDVNRKVSIKEDDFPDPLESVFTCNYDTSIRPDCVVSLLENGIFLSSRLYGSQQKFLPRSYVFNAIMYNKPAALEIFIKYGVLSEIVNIEDIFCVDREWFRHAGSYTWLTLAVELGRAACVKAIVEESKDSIELVKKQDAGGRCAISLAQSLVAESHPRTSALHDLHWIQYRRHESEMKVSVSDDNAVLDILTAALNRTGSFEAPPNADATRSESPSIYVLQMRGPMPEQRGNKPGEESFSVWLYFIGLYGVLIGYSLLQLAFLRRTQQQHMSRAVLFLCIAISLSLAASYFIL